MYVMIWAVQSSLYKHKSLRKEDSGTGYEQKADWKKVKRHEDKWIKTNQNEDKLDGDWNQSGPNKVFLKLYLWGLKILILKEKCVKYLHHLKS